MVGQEAHAVDDKTWYVVERRRFSAFLRHSVHEERCHSLSTREAHLSTGKLDRRQRSGPI